MTINIQKELNARGQSWYWLGKQLGFRKNKNTVYRWKRGVHTISPSYIKEICKVFRNYDKNNLYK